MKTTSSDVKAPPRAESAGSNGPAGTAAPAGSAGGRPPGAWRLQGLGVLLFLFIPLVLFLFVRHPEPIAASLGLGIGLMLGHRFLARPYMARAVARKCVWCNRVLAPASGAVTEPLATDAGIETPAPGAAPPLPLPLALAAGGKPIAARCCAAHRAPAARFFRWLHLARLPLRLGIFAPLLLLLAALAAAAAGHPQALPAATALFQLLIGLAVSAAAWGLLLVEAPAGSAPIPVPFPAHNFFLLGVRSLLWIFRLVGAWWIYRGLSLWWR